MKRRYFLGFLAAGLVSLSTGSVAFAQAGQALFDYQIRNLAQTDSESPMLIMRAKEYIKSGEVVMKRSDGQTQRTKLGSLKPGQEKRVPFKQKKGSFDYEISVTGTTNFDQTLETSFTTTVHYVDPIQMTVDREQVRVAEGELILGVNVPLDKVEIEIYDENGTKVVERTQAIGGKAGDIKITWPATKAGVGGIKLVAHDVAGFWAGVILEPFWVDIPHEDIVFDFGKDTWQPSEEPKLEATLKRVQEAMSKHRSKGLDMSLYVAGYTDTVGGAADNIKLSQARARAIGAWFKKKGLKINVFSQGFGESVLAVQTADNVSEEKNRRALLILGNAPPPTSSQIPKANWKKL